MKVTRSAFDDPVLAAWWDASYEKDILIRNTFFQSRHWTRCWSDAFVAPDARRELMLLRVEDKGGIVAAVPLFLQRRAVGPFTAWRYFLWVGDQLAQYPDMATTRGDTANVWDAVIRFLAGEFPDAWLLLRDALPDSSCAAIRSRARMRTGATYLRLPLAGRDEQTYLASCTPHLRRTVTRARKRLSGEPAMRWHAVRNPDSGLIDRLIDLSIQRFGASSWFADARHTAFFRALCVRAGHEVLFTLVEHDGAPIHLLASYLHGGVLHYVLSGMDIRYLEMRPGIMNLDATICWAMREGYATFDFLRGDEAYKREFAPEQRCAADFEIPLSGRGMRRSLAHAAQRLRRLDGAAPEDRP